MKKNFLIVSFAILALGFVYLTSCSDDNDDPYVNVDKELVENGIKADLFGDFILIPIHSNSDWKVEVTNNPDWVSVVTPAGSGNGEAMIQVAENQTETGRKAELVITSGKEMQKICIYQEVEEYTGGSISSSSAFPSVSSNFGLGVGLDFTKNECQTKGVVVNFITLNKIIKEDDTFGSLFTHSYSGEYELQRTMKDSIEAKMDSLGVRASLNIAYSKFKFGIGAYITSNEVRTDSMFQFGVRAFYSKEAAQYDIASIYELFNADNSDVPDNIAKLKTGLFNIGFSGVRKRIMEAYKKYTGDSKEFQEKVDNMINTYGTLVTSQTKVGCSAIFDVQTDATCTIDTLSVDSATVGGEFADIFKANGKVEYKKTANEILRNSNYSMYFVGGALKNILSVKSAFDKIRQDKTDSTVPVIDEALNDWIHYVNTDINNKNDFNGAVVSLSYIPIWIFFDDEDGVSSAVKKYILNKKKDIKEYDIYRDSVMVE